MPKETKINNNKKMNKNTKQYISGYLYNMSYAPSLDQSTNWFQMFPIAFFTAFIIMITRMHQYERPMQQFFWSDGNTQIIDFFSYFKMVAILLCASLALIIILYRLFSQSFSIVKSILYIPMIIYSVFVLLSYTMSDYKLFALWGYNDRFEGTITLLSYMIMLFFIINSVRTERDVKWVIYPVAVTSALLGLLGLSQAFDHDFFRTELGKKLITPSWFWGNLDSLNFTFQNKEIYQTVYNINYVSFYLTLLIPLFGMLFIRSCMLGKEEPVWKKVLWGLLFSLLIYNLIGSASSGGILGMAIVVTLGIVILNKRILKWVQPVLILVVISLIMTGISYERWYPELSNAVDSVLGKNSTPQTETIKETDVRHKIDYMVTSGESILLSFEGNEINFQTFPKSPGSLQILDSDGAALAVIPTNIKPIYRIDDPRFDQITVRPAQDESGNNYFIIGTDGNEWPFRLTKNGPKYINGMGQLVDLHKVPAIGWKNNQEFGSGRGYIWSRSIPMLKDTLILGHGADTYCIYFPQEDYVGKYNSGTFSANKDIVVDKPHNLYLGAIIGTGGISMLALLALWGIYIVQCFLIYKKEEYNSFIKFAGVGIFLGICGFLVSAIVNDSSVSTMPMFYGLLGTGIAINLMLKYKRQDALTA